MLFVSSVRRYQHAIHGERWDHHPATGQPIIHHPALVAEFRQGGVPDWAREVAVRSLRFGGVAYDEDVALRLSMYDTDEQARLNGWDAETKRRVEEKLLAEQNEYYAKVELPKLAKPWRTVDDVKGGGRGVTRAKALAATADDIGVSLAEVIAYAKQEGYPADVVGELEAEQQTRDLAGSGEELVPA